MSTMAKQKTSDAKRVKFISFQRTASTLGRYELHNNKADEDFLQPHNFTGSGYS